MELVARDLLLRPPRAADLPAVVEACRDPAVGRFIPVIPSPYGEADARTWLAAADRGWAGGGERAFAIVDRASGRFLGSIEVRLHDGGSVGYWLAPAARSRGVATRALQAVADWARDAHGLGTLVLTAHPDNAASRRVAERAGFVRGGMVPHAPPFRDGLDTAILFTRRLRPVASYEYRTEVLTHGFLGRKEEELDRADFEERLNALGAEGWEFDKLLTHVSLHGEKDGHLLVFRRERA